jgi:hypothetical protein
MKAFKARLEDAELERANMDMERIPLVATYTLIRWVLDAKRESKGYGFPFDRPHVEFYRRLKETHRLLGGIMHVHLRKEAQDNRPLTKLFSQLDKVLGDDILSESIAGIEAKADVFDRLRQALRIALPTGKDGLNDDGDPADMKTLEKQVGNFRQWLTSDPCRQETYAKMIQQMDKYWDKLFADPIRVKTPAGETLMAPQRTNNILERFFRAEKRRARKKTGTASLTKTLKAILADTPLVRNLDNQDYRKIILNGCSCLAERFSQIDSRRVQRYMKDAENAKERISPEVKKIIRDAELPQKISALFIPTSKPHTNRHLRS